MGGRRSARRAAGTARSRRLPTERPRHGWQTNPRRSCCAPLCHLLYIFGICAVTCILLVSHCIMLSFGSQDSHSVFFYNWRISAWIRIFSWMWLSSCVAKPMAESNPNPNVLYKPSLSGEIKAQILFPTSNRNVTLSSIKPFFFVLASDSISEFYLETRTVNQNWYLIVMWPLWHLHGAQLLFLIPDLSTRDK